MRCDRPLIVAVVFLGIGLGVLIGYGAGHIGFNASYPFADSMLHTDLTTTGPGVLGGLAIGVAGALLLVWAFLAAIVSLFTGGGRTHMREERFSVVPRVEDGDSSVPESAEEREGLWTNQRSRTQI